MPLIKNNCLSCTHLLIVRATHFQVIVGMPFNQNNCLSFTHLLIARATHFQANVLRESPPREQGCRNDDLAQPCNNSVRSGTPDTSWEDEMGKMEGTGGPGACHAEAKIAGFAGRLAIEFKIVILSGALALITRITLH